MNSSLRDPMVRDRLLAVVSGQVGLLALLWVASFGLLLWLLLWVLLAGDPPSVFARAESAARLWPLWAPWLLVLGWYGATLGRERREIARDQTFLDLDDQRAVHSAARLRLDREPRPERGVG